jgi:Inner membrane component of T3SS, cytoplasmic domain
MKSCPKCLNLSDDAAPACEHCGTVLDDSLIARAEGPGGARMPTVLESAARPRPSPPPPSGFRPEVPSPPPGAAKAAGATPGRRGQTVFMPPSEVQATAGRAAGQASLPRTTERKIVAVLVTYSWRPEGQIFPLREGRNLIGRGEECEIRIAEDPMLSQVNSHITFRQNFVLGDMVSMSGTDLNGAPVEEQFRPIENYASIRTGSTHWIFVVLDPALTARGS